jgi:hypothetical protein
MSGAERQGGSISMTALSILVLMASVVAGVALILQASLSYSGRSAQRDSIRLPLEQEAERVIRALSEDPTPEADCPLDPVWDAVAEPETEGVKITLEDVSSRLDPNWIQKAVLEKTHLGEMLQTGRTAAELQQRREDNGFSIDLQSEYGDLIKEETLQKYFSPYGYANINTTDEFALRRLYALRTGDDPGSEVFHARVQRLLTEKKILKPSELRVFLGAEFDALFPVMNAEPIYNVHFIDPLLLTELLSYPDWKIRAPSRAARLILDSRSGTELTARELRKIIGAAENNRIYQYLGATTWFWKIVVSTEKASLEIIAARLPAEGEAAAQYLIAEERFSL